MKDEGYEACMKNMHLTDSVRKVHVNASNEYEILIGRGLIQKAGELIEENCFIKEGSKTSGRPSKIAVITDSVVEKLYLKKLIKGLESLCSEIVCFTFPNGEQSKNIYTFSKIVEFLAVQELTRSDMIIALGGGVVGDVAGFAAASYLRGIDFIQIPTTFLAAVDSSVGGKTAIDLEAGKNLCGAFHQPRLVICDCDTFETLSDEIFSDGSAEAIKYGMLRETRLLKYFEEGCVKENIEDIIEECVSIKRDIVGEDEFDKGTRQLLNLGHTFGHAIEKKSMFTISHGHAVAVGMAVAARISEKLGMLSADNRKRLESIIHKNGLEISIAELKYSYSREMHSKEVNCTEISNQISVNEYYNKESIAELTLRDKKRSGNIINLILPICIGKSVIYPINVNEIERLLTDEVLTGFR